MPKVDWSSPKATWAAVARRRAVRRDETQLGGINIATFFWSDGDTSYATTRWSESPLGTQADTVQHSEEVIWSLIKARCKTIYWVFTERAPCPPHPVGRGCSVWLPEVLAKVGAAKELTPVYWIYPYPDNEGKGYEDIQDLASRLPQGKTPNPYLLGLAAKMVRDEATSGLRGIDEQIAQDYGKYGSTGRNTVKGDIHGLKTAFNKENRDYVLDMP